MPKNGCGETINFEVTLTDMDTREHSALASIWPGIFLLLCIFHVYQAWRNGLNRYLKPIPKGVAKKETRTRLGKLLMCLLKEETVHSEAMKAYKAEITYFKRLGRKRDPLSKIHSSAALAFLGYLSDYVGKAKWTAYSLAGTIEAARILGVPVDSLPRTLNHLEGFNGCIKGPMYAAYRHNGHLPWIDVWIHASITTVISAFFEKRCSCVAPSLTEPTTSPALSPSLFTSSPSSSSFTSSGPQSLQHSIPARTTHDQRIEKWLEELINDTDLDEDNTDIPTPEEIASMMAKLDLCPDNRMDIKDAPVAEDILAMEIPISVLDKPPSELLSPLPFLPLTLENAHPPPVTDLTNHLKQFKAEPFERT
ncbi:hypothetical protein B0H14DRAFT_3776063 [Mycena olivaceomarginata]|nr:hypothetical protein B0H14DRAFT_3776063 [Mycena olivaceomarginata]